MVKRKCAVDKSSVDRESRKSMNKSFNRNIDILSLIKHDCVVGIATPAWEVAILEKIHPMK